MRDAGIRKFVNPYAKIKYPQMEPVQEVSTKESGQIEPVEEEEEKMVES